MASLSIPEAYVKAYHANVVTQYVENGGKLMPIVGELHDGVIAETDHFDRYKEDDAQEKTTLYEQQSTNNPVISRRFVNLRDFYWNGWIDRQSRLRMLLEPESYYVRNAVNALRRKTDALIYSALRGSAWEGKANPTQVALPASQKIAAGGTGLTVSKVISAAQILNQNNVPFEDRYFIINAAGLDDLLRETQVTSRDFATIQALMTGQITFYMGFNWILYNYPAEGGTHYAVACHKSAVGLARAQEPQVEVDRLPDRHYLVQVYAAHSLNAVRVQDEGVVEVAYV